MDIHNELNNMLDLVFNKTVETVMEDVKEGESEAAVRGVVALRDMYASYAQQARESENILIQRAKQRDLVVEMLLNRLGGSVVITKAEYKAIPKDTVVRYEAGEEDESLTVSVEKMGGKE